MTGQNYLEYGNCKVCKNETIYQWIGEMGKEVGVPITLYNCLKCHGTFMLNKLEQKVQELK